MVDFGELNTAVGRLRLRQATHDVGFFYLAGHGVSTVLIDEVIAVARRFFALPVQE